MTVLIFLVSHKKAFCFVRDRFFFSAWGSFFARFVRRRRGSKSKKQEKKKKKKEKEKRKRKKVFFF
jgi:hypothetical protein